MWYYTIPQINAYITQHMVANNFFMRQGAANVTGVQIQQVTNAYTVQIVLQGIPTVAPTILV